MKPIYNEYLATMDPHAKALGERFFQYVKDLFQDVESRDLNLREMAHEFVGLILVAEAEAVLARSLKMQKAERYCEKEACAKYGVSKARCIVCQAMFCPNCHQGVCPCGVPIPPRGGAFLANRWDEGFFGKPKAHDLKELAATAYAEYKKWTGTTIDIEALNNQIGLEKIPFKRFTDRARRAIGLATQEAQRFHHEYVGTEHILLGLIQEGSGVAANVLRCLGLDLLKLRSEVEKIVSHGPPLVVKSQMPFTPRGKRALQLAVEMTSRWGHNYIGTEHLIIGLIREGDGVAGQVLANLAITPAAVEAEVMRILGGLPSAQDHPDDVGLGGP